jgi:hypothetical protein
MNGGTRSAGSRSPCPSGPRRSRAGGRGGGRSRAAFARRRPAPPGTARGSTRARTAADTASSAPTGAPAPAATPPSPGEPPVPSSAGLRSSDRTRVPCTKMAPAARTRRCRSARARSHGPARRTSGTPGTPARRTLAAAHPPGRRTRPLRGTSQGAPARRGGGRRARSRGAGTWRLRRPCPVSTANTGPGGMPRM